MASLNRDATVADAPQTSRWRDPRPWRAFRHAADGVEYVVQTQRNMLIHLLALAGVVGLAALLRVEASGLAALCLVGVLVLVAEMFNTAVETVVDLITADFHPLAKRAKDIAAGGVLLAAIGAVIVGVVVFGWMRSPTVWGGALPPHTLWIVPTLLLLPLVGLAAVRLRRPAPTFEDHDRAGKPWKSAPQSSDAPQKVSTTVGTTE